MKPPLSRVLKCLVNRDFVSIALVVRFVKKLSTGVKMSHECQNWALKQQNLPGNSKLVLLVLAFHADKKGECWPSMKTLSEETCLSPATIYRALNILLDKKILEIQKRFKNGKSNYYILKSYPQNTSQFERHGEKIPLNLRKNTSQFEKDTSQSERYTININKNINIESHFDKKEKVQEMYKSSPTPLGDMLKELAVKKVIKQNLDE